MRIIPARTLVARAVRRAAAKFNTILPAACCAIALTATNASAVPLIFSGLSADGHPVSGSAEFTLNAGADTVTVKIINTTALTNDAGELLTGVDFMLGGLTPTLTSDTGIQRTVDNAGAFTDTGSAQDLSWSLASLGSGTFQLNFNPNAKDSIIGPPTAGSYSGANGSINGNAGHNPFAAEMALFSLSVPGLEADTVVTVKEFRYGTDLKQAEGTIVPFPEPSTVIMAAFGLIAVGCRRLRRR